MLFDEPVYPRYLPIAMRINPDGTHIEREYEGFDGLLLTDVVQLNNGNYFAAGDFSNEAVGVMVLDENLDIVAARRYERAGASLSVFGGKLLLDDDGTVVMSGTARYPSQYGGCEDRPYLYRFDENADTLRCRYVMAQMPAPEYYLFQYECHQILRDPRGDGLVLMGVGKNGKPALICYDHDFNYISNIWMDNGSMLLFTQFSSCCWMSDEELLVFGTLWPSSENERAIALLDVKLSGGVPRLDTIKGDASSYHIACPKLNCTAFANDTTIYGSYYSTDNMYSGPFHLSVCLFDKDMEVLGNFVYEDEEHLNYVPCFILPQNDGGCILVAVYSDGSINYNTIGKIIKMSREDINPISYGVDKKSEYGNQIFVYPNLASDEIQIDITALPMGDNCFFSIQDMSGRIILNRGFCREDTRLTINIAPLIPGLYFYSIYYNQQILLSGKLIKK